MTDIDRLLIALLIIGCTAINTILILSMSFTLKLYLDDLWRQGEKTKRKVKKIVKHRQSIKHCKFSAGDSGVQFCTIVLCADV